MPPSAAPPIDCTTAAQRLWDYLDAELDASHLAEVEAHLRGCSECGPHFSFAGRLAEQIAASRTAVEPCEALHERVVAALAAEGFRRS
ncbi:MAG: zf-HC2 domain-containing protein [Gemmatimonadaceae bacterium]|nr:zf-HC2 domain-containing protein [Gemmatimonadaceae bacterium]